MVKLNGNSRKGKGGSTYVAPENVYVQVMGVNEVNPKAPTPAEDTIDAGLLADAFGLVAEFDADGNPTTIVKARIAQDEATKKRRYSNPDPTKQPTEMYDLKTGRKKGTGDRMGKAPVVILEKAKLNAAGEIEAGFIFIAQRDRESEKELVIENVLSSVSEEGTANDGTKFQKRKIYLAEEAVVVGSMEELRAAIKSKLEDDRAEKPFALIRVIENKVYPETDKDEEGKDVSRYPYEALAATVYRGWENNAALSIDESIDRWFANPPKDRDAEMVGAIQDFLVDKAEDHENLMFEVIGGFTYNTGKQSLPSANGRRSDHYSFQMDWENPATGRTSIDRKTQKPFTAQGVSRAHMILGRVEDNETPGTYGSWYAQKTFTTKAYGADIFQEREIITPNVPEQIAALFQAQAERREKARSDKFRNKDNGRAATQDDDHIPQGDEQPDYSGGMAMGR